MSVPPTDTDPDNLNYPVTFKSEVGNFYYGVLLFVAVTTVAAFKPAFDVQQVGTLLPPLIFTLLLGWGLPVWMLLATDYTVTEDLLKIRCGPLKWTINRADIQGIKASRNLISSPALSLDRLEISYKGYKHILVSPRDRAGFYRALGFTPAP